MQLHYFCIQLSFVIDLHLSPLRERTLRSLVRVWPWDCLDWPVITPESSLLALRSAFKLLPGTESGSMESEGVAAAALWD